MTSSTMTAGTSPRRLGIWLDHRCAHLIELRGATVSAATIPSEVPRKHRATGGTRVPGRAFVRSAAASQDHMASQRAEAIRRYLEDIVAAAAGADEIVILGPGGARKELAARLEGDRSLAARLKGVFAAPKMTDRQLVAQVKSLFH